MLSLDLNTPEGSADKLATDYFQIIRNNDKVKYMYKARIDKSEKSQKNLKGALKRSTLKAKDLSRRGVAALGK